MLLDLARCSRGSIRAAAGVIALADRQSNGRWEAGLRGAWAARQSKRQIRRRSCVELHASLCKARCRQWKGLVVSLPASLTQTSPLHCCTPHRLPARRPNRGAGAAHGPGLPGRPGTHAAAGQLGAAQRQRPARLGGVSALQPSLDAVFERMVAARQALTVDTQPHSHPWFALGPTLALQPRYRTCRASRPHLGRGHALYTSPTFRFASLLSSRGQRTPVTDVHAASVHCTP